MRILGKFFCVCLLLAFPAICSAYYFDQTEPSFFPSFEGFYLGVGLNYPANIRSDFDSFTQSSQQNGFAPDKLFREKDIIDQHSCLHNEPGFNVFVGYQYHKNFGLEAFFDYYNEFEFQIKNTLKQKITSSGILLTNINAITKLKFDPRDTYLLGLAGTGAIPLLNWLELFAKLGAAFYITDLRVNLIIDNTDNGQSARDFSRINTNMRQDLDFCGIALIYGVGLKFYITDSFIVRLEYDGYETSDSNNIRFIIPNQIALNLIYYITD